ncbi:type II secretion system protein [Virgibacillus sp. NKC19-16]|uniref:type II secretion system protein n=1 Tax=Virgibacillus salidurans TaxID=2831673 RepID=UPI001F276E00|nr:type II secretion system protein [Virgibacillus sp. NKC19-16]UJL44840.1 type II secretion system protein [Virgibacillus sp. NKC19-16]
MKNNGFTLIEVLVASSVLMMVISTVVPIISLITEHQSLLSDRRTFNYYLHDELQPYLHQQETALPTNYSETIHNKTVTFEFQMVNELVKGCAEWQNVKNNNEVICLYGYREK